MTPIFLANEGEGTYCSHEKYIYSTKAQALFNWKINQQYSDIYIYIFNKSTTLFFKCYVPKELYHVSDICLVTTCQN